MSDSKTKIEQILNLIAELKTDHKGTLSIVCENGCDEAIITGSTEGYLNLAETLLKNVATLKFGASYGLDEPEFESKNGDEILISYDIKDHFNEFGDVFPVSLYITNKEDKVEALTKSISSRF